MFDALVRISFGRLIQGYKKRILRFEAPAQLHNLFMQSVIYSESPSELLEALVTPGTTSSDPRKEKGPLFPNFYDSGERVRGLLALVVREFRPHTIVETGVAHGRSTKVFLTEIRALSRVEGAHRFSLHSIDVDPRTANGDWSSDPLWNFHLLSPQNTLEKIFESIGKIDMFFHDSDHGYRNQMREYELAWQYLAPGGLLISDDVSWSNAFIDFAGRQGLKPFILSEAPKVAGLIRKPND